MVESPAPTTNEVILATKKRIGEVDAIYVPNDTTIVAALEAIVKVGQDVDMPIFTGETGGVGRGAIASVGLDYVAVGRGQHGRRHPRGRQCRGHRRGHRL